MQSPDQNNQTLHQTLQTTPPFGWCASALAGPPRVTQRGILCCGLVEKVLKQDPNGWNILWHSLEKCWGRRVEKRKQTKRSTGVISTLYLILYTSTIPVMRKPKVRISEVGPLNFKDESFPPAQLGPQGAEGPELICIHRKLACCGWKSTRLLQKYFQNDLGLAWIYVH